ncbi:hypothetical protein ACFL4T_11125 [candidate division KSB1 bacterium]
MKKFGIYFFIILFAIQCKKPTGDELSPFDGITETDPIGRIVSIDPNDWGYDRYFTVEYDTLDGQTIPMESVIYPPFPNPAFEIITFKFGLNYSLNVNIEILSQKGNRVKLISLKEPLKEGIHYLHWDLSDNKGEKLKSGLYRIIFKYLDGIEEVFTCVGDVQIY